MKKLPYLTINIIGLLLVTACFFSYEFTMLGAAGISIAVFFCRGIGPLVLLVINLAAFFAVKNDKITLGILFSLPFGSPGSLIAMKRVNNNYKAGVAIKCVSLIHIWFAIWTAASFLLWLFEFHGSRPLM